MAVLYLGLLFFSLDRFGNVGRCIFKVGILALLGPRQDLVGKISVFGVLTAEFDGGFVSGKLDDISISDFFSVSYIGLFFQPLQNGLP